MTSLAAARPLPSAPAAAGSADAVWRRRLLLLLGVQSLLLVLTSINRLSDVTAAPLLPNEGLRGVELVNLLVLPPVSALGWYLVLEHVLARGADRRLRRRLRLAFAAALYLFALSYGMHEPANYLSERFCQGAGGDGLCAAIAYQDDELSHLLFFAGFAGIQAVLLAAQAAVAGATAALRGGERVLLLANAGLVAAAIVANLAFEEIGLDLAVIAALAAGATWLLRRHGPAPLLVYFAAANLGGLVVTAALTLA
jgi:hypothetical protein